MKNRVAVTLLACCALPVLAGEFLEFRLAQSKPANGWEKVEFEADR